MKRNPSRFDRECNRDYYANPKYLLVCLNGECGLSLPIRLPKYNTRCPRCGCAMTPVKTEQ